MNKVVLITGTSSGFGYFISLELASKGYQVVSTMRSLNNSQQLKEEANKVGCKNNMDVVKMDVTIESDIRDVVQYIKENYGKIDILINNAGYCLGGISEFITVKEWERQFATNLFGVISVTNAFLPIMRKQRSGKIINIGSISGRIGLPGLSPYASSKFALEGYSESLRLELLPFNISVSIIEAGSYNTKIWEKAMKNIDTKVTHHDYSKYLSTLYKNAETTSKKASNPIEVINIVQKICRSKRPRLRYIVGNGVRLTIFLKSILPWSWIEYMIGRKLKN
ncbi:SDR family oxidoreductase [Evansella cellulosilytica]|uniref:Short-chain dehydrogenase/reductase SDR n=1 Tax=Evansella cellulosilytica (strain ATCC 21833 / DSM 2522 / FERM P-1141 / JCM 9156 / N-4) TaxID=649639 RepID=E6U110_EVAC2|nr:SDR family oxidoreductase [Evansella cellulosilytica]ADU30322.1 short-chain dehydrogenase/reductase SDR [Evansella cellulosilytica DSM 2522]